MRTIRRGYLPEYEKLFRDKGILALREAVMDALFLLNRGHSLKRATTIAMEHYQLTESQRVALSRGLCTDAEILRRRKTQLQREDVAGGFVFALRLGGACPAQTPRHRQMDLLNVAEIVWYNIRKFYGD